jgi:nucleotide-binding universal stress UspA family protein
MTRAEEDPIETVLCATDFSETASQALHHATRLASRHQARLVLVHIVEPLPADPYPMPAALPTGEANLRELGSERLQQLAREIAAPGLRVETRLEMGPPGSQLLEVAERERASLIVLGTRGLTGFRHLVFGSTAEHVVRCARCPVLTVHPEDPEPVDDPSVVILPTDLSADAEVAADAFLALYGEATGAHLVLTFADSTPPYLDALQHERLEEWHEPDARREDLEARLAPMADRLRSRGFEVEVRIQDGGAVDVITSLAEARGSDLIVMSTHGHSALVNVLLGRTAQRVVQHAKCPVLTVRPPRRD